MPRLAATQASRVLNAHGFHPEEQVLVHGSWPFFTTASAFDVVIANGVLHHTPKMSYILARLLQVLRPVTGEVRLLLYNEKMWSYATGLPPPPFDEPARGSPGYSAFVAFADGVGHYSDFYSPKRLLFAVRLTPIGYRWAKRPQATEYRREGGTPPHIPLVLFGRKRALANIPCPGAFRASSHPPQTPPSTWLRAAGRQEATTR